jgi:molecular chaperone DnaK
MQVHDGIIEVVNNGGDNHLGGKLIDWAIVEELLIPAVTSQFRVTDFRRGNPKWQKAVAKLKLAAEQAKIGVSRDDSSEIMIDSLCQDDSGENVTFEFDLRRTNVERIAQSFILRSVNICRKVLAEQHLKIENVEKVLLVGGPTLMPYLREYLADTKEGLGIPLDFSLDPLTVVARGAAILAAAQRNETTTTTPVVAGTYGLELQYKAVGYDTEPQVAGRAQASEEQSFGGFTVEFINATARTPWRSGKVALADNGSFMTSLWAESQKQNQFQVELQDATGTRREVSPDSFTYTHGMEMDNPTLSHSVGLALANNEVRIFLEKGTQLPARKRFVQKLAYRVRKGETNEAIRIPVVEGEHKKADRNKLIGYLEIPATQIKRDLPAGAEIEVTIEINQSRLVRTEAFLTILNEEYEVNFEMGQEVPDPAVLKEELELEKQRLEEAREKAEVAFDEKAMPILERIEEEQILKEVESTLAAASVDQDAAIKCQNRLLDLRATVDQLEEALEIPILLAEAEQMIEWTEKVVGKWGQSADQRKFAMLRRELKATMEARVLNPGDLTRKIDNMDELRMKILRAQDEWWMDFLAHLEERRPSMANQPLVDQLFSQAMRSINNNDIEGVKSACKQLVQLLPARQQQLVGRFRSTVMN